MTNTLSTQTFRGKLSLKLSGDLTDIMHRNELRRVLIHAACTSCGAHLKRRRISILHEIPMMDIFVAQVPMRALPVLATMGYIKHIEDDLRLKFHIDRARHTIAADILPDPSLTGKGITVAIVDSGVYPHVDFGNPSRIRFFLDIVGGKTEPYDDVGHGTFCAGCIAGDGAASSGKYTGIAREADIVMIKGMDKEEGGRISDLLRAFQWISDNAKTYGIRVVSLSLGVDAKEINPQKDTLAEAVGLLWRQGQTVVAAAGNEGPEPGTIGSPGTAPEIITVGAADDRTKPGEIFIAEFSSRDKEGGKKPDILAPGVDIAGLGTEPKQYVQMSGTSMATPIIAGCAALILQKHPHYTPDDVKKTLLDHAVTLNLPENHQGKGIISLRDIF